MANSCIIQHLTSLGYKVEKISRDDDPIVDIIATNGSRAWVLTDYANVHRCSSGDCSGVMIFDCDIPFVRDILKSNAESNFYIGAYLYTMAVNHRDSKIMFVNYSHDFMYREIK